MSDIRSTGNLGTSETRLGVTGLGVTGQGVTGLEAPGRGASPSRIASRTETVHPESRRRIPTLRQLA
ncbi:MAG: hypothetical protein WCK65_15875, partial [Rhodospirillaceae bacterium]